MKSFKLNQLQRNYSSPREIKSEITSRRNWNKIFVRKIDLTKMTATFFKLRMKLWTFDFIVWQLIIVTNKTPIMLIARKNMLKEHIRDKHSPHKTHAHSQHTAERIIISEKTTWKNYLNSFENINLSCFRKNYQIK